MKEKKRSKVIETRNHSITHKENLWTDDPYLLLKEELKKRREKYSILKTTTSLKGQDKKLLKDLNDKLDGALHRRTEAKNL